MNKSSRFLAIAATLFFGCATTAFSQTIAYWRFEGDATARLSDSSGNGRTLTTQNSSGIAYTSPLPATGAGSDFFNPIPLTGASNTQFVAKTGTTTSTGGFFTTPDNAAFTSNTLTIETLINVTSVTGISFLVGHWDGAANQRSYALSLDSAGQVQATLSGNGTSSSILTSGITLTTGKDYYLGLAIDLSPAAAADRYVQFWVQNLTDNTAMQTATVSNISISSLHNSTQLFSVGAQAQGGSAGSWQGFFDEVRVSNVVLSESQLLVVPEPSAVALIGLAVFCGLAGRRRRS